MFFKRKNKPNSKENQSDIIFKNFIEDKTNIENIIKNSGKYNFISCAPLIDSTNKKNHEICIHIQDKETFAKGIISLGKYGITSFTTLLDKTTYPSEESSVLKEPKLINIYKSYLDEILKITDRTFIQELIQHRNQKQNEARSSIESAKKAIQWLSLQTKNNLSMMSEFDVQELLSREKLRYDTSEKNLKTHLKLYEALIQASKKLESNRG